MNLISAASISLDIYYTVTDNGRKWIGLQLLIQLHMRHTELAYVYLIDHFIVFFTPETKVKGENVSGPCGQARSICRCECMYLHVPGQCPLDPKGGMVRRLGNIRDFPPSPPPLPLLPHSNF